MPTANELTAIFTGVGAVFAGAGAIAAGFAARFAFRQAKAAERALERPMPSIIASERAKSSDGSYWMVDLEVVNEATIRLKPTGIFVHKGHSPMCKIGWIGTDPYLGARLDLQSGLYDEWVGPKDATPTRISRLTICLEGVSEHDAHLVFEFTWADQPRKKSTVGFQV